VKAVFLDASAWFAAIDPNAQHHEAAIARYHAAARSDADIVTTHLVIAEVHALVMSRRGLRAGQDFLRDALGGGGIHVIHPAAELIQAAATNWVMRYSDQRFSLCDAVSFEVMRRERVRRVLTLDRDFAAAGFEIVD